MEICPIILCGGEGTRLWPVSRRNFPKQFVPLVGEHSCFQQAVLRFQGMEGGSWPLIVTGAAHEDIVRAQLLAIGMRADILLEPEGRDSGPATAVAAAFLIGEKRDCVAIMQPADHYIPDVEEFRRVAMLAASGAAKGYIVTFGITPDFPETAYGYIQAGDDIGGGVSAVRQFVEKPSREKAVEYLKHGYVWNSGMFAFRPETLLGEMERYEPLIAASVREAIAKGTRRGDVLQLDAASFARATKKSLDHAVMERTKNAAVVPASFAWSDLGSWKAIYDARPKDERGNAVLGPNAVVFESDNCLVRASDVPVALIGMRDVAVIAEADGIIVSRLDATAGVKNAVEAFRAKSRPEALRTSVVGGLSCDFANLRDAAAAFSRWLRSSALPLWWAAGADHEHGGFFELLNEQGCAVHAPRRLRVQARQIHVFAAASSAGWPGPWKTAAHSGLDYLAAKYRRPDGFYRTLVTDDGQPADDGALLYDQAFVLLALAGAAKADIEKSRCVDEARSLRTLLLDKWTHEAGGFREAAIHGSTLQSNPHMHLLEAALAWREIGDTGWAVLADSIVELCLTKFIDGRSGALREFFDDAGHPMQGLAGRIVEPGHQFEWAWLLTQANSTDDKIHMAAHRLFEFGERRGVDTLRDIAMDALLDDGVAHIRQARLWPQTERLKAALALAKLAANETQRTEFEAAALNAAKGLSYYLQMMVPGLWRDKMRPDGTFIAEVSPASSLYHIAGAIMALGEYAKI
jgi:mannose-1-phosphate guanylyltransferase/mannose-6-phosphate isomerase